MSENQVKEPVESYSGIYTYADYLKFEFDEMVELIKGKIYRMSPAPRITHQQISMRFSRIFSNYFSTNSCQVFHAPTDVVLPIPNRNKESANTVVQPDLFVVCDNNKIQELCIFGAPDLIVEILSPHTRKKDFQFKYEVYEEAGVREYWIVMPNEKLLEVFVLEGGRYQRIQTYTDTDIVPCNIFPELEVNLTEVFTE